jgi:hypothetical protein
LGTEGSVQNLSQSVIEGFERIRQQLPMGFQGIDSDNDSALINDTAASYCRKEDLQFTRSRELGEPPAPEHPLMTSIGQ